MSESWEIKGKGLEARTFLWGTWLGRKMGNGLNATIIPNGSVLVSEGRTIRILNENNFRNELAARGIPISLEMERVFSDIRYALDNGLVEFDDYGGVRPVVGKITSN